MKTQRAAMWVLAAAVVGGCAVDQEQEMQRYRKEVDLHGAATQPTTLPSEWPADKTLSLREALLLGNQQNERLSLEGENYLQALIERKRVVGFFLPTADLTSISILAENVGGDTPNHATDAIASGRINIFNGFRDIARLRAAGLTSAQRRLLLLDVQESLLADVVRAYHVVLSAEAQTRVLQGTVQLQEARVRDITQRQQAGLARVLDVAQTQAQLSATRVTLITAQTAVLNGRQALVVLTNAQVADAPLDDRELLPAETRDLATLKQLALEQRPDLLAAEEAKNAARQQVEVAVGQYYPSASVNLDYFLHRETQPDDRAWDSVLQVNLPIFSAGQIEADVREAWSRFRQASMSQTLLRRQVLQDVEISYTSYMAGIGRVAELRVEVAAAKQALEQADASYNAGLATNLERLTAQDQYLSAQLGLTRELYSQRVDSSQLLVAIGALRQWVEQELAATMPASLPAASQAAPVTQPANQ